MNVDFYILEQANYQQALLLACKLVDELYPSEPSIYIHTTSLDEANKLDTLLWTFRDDSFLPHQLYEPSEPFPGPIQIGHSITPLQKDVMINLSKTVPDFFQQFKRIIEIVFPEPTVQQLARERYKHYRDSGCNLTTHKIKA